MQVAFYGFILVAIGIAAVFVLVRRNARAEATSRPQRISPAADPSRDLAYFTEHYVQEVDRMRSGVLTAQAEVSTCLDTFRRERMLLWKSMRDVERFLIANAEFFTGSMLSAAERDANLKSCENNFVKSQKCLHDAVNQVHERLVDLYLKVMQLEIWLYRVDSVEVSEKARALLGEVEAECTSIYAVMRSIITDSMTEPVGVPEASSSTVTSWRQSRRLERNIYQHVLSAPPS